MDRRLAMNMEMRCIFEKNVESRGYRQAHTEYPDDSQSHASGSIKVSSKCLTRVCVLTWNCGILVGTAYCCQRICRTVYILIRPTPWVTPLTHGAFKGESQIQRGQTKIFTCKNSPGEMDIGPERE